MSHGSFIVTGELLSLQVAHRHGRVCAVDFLPPEPSLPVCGPPEELVGTFELLDLYLRGERVDFSDVPLDLSELTPFCREVLGILQGVPYGEVRTYGWLAQACGKPGGAQAIGQALGHNPVPVILPCHRIISADGSLGGFMRNVPEGADLKTRLLSLEGIFTPLKAPWVRS